MAVSTGYVDHEFPVCFGDPPSDAKDGVDFGQFLSALESEKGKLTCLQGGHGRHVVYNSPCLPLTQPCVCSGYDNVQLSRHGQPNPGTKFKIFKQLSYIYTNYPEEWLPVGVVTRLLNEPTSANHHNGSAMTFVPCSGSTDASYIGYLVFASGPELCTLTVGGVSTQLGTKELSVPASYAEWSRDHVPLSLRSIEAYDLPSEIRCVHFKNVQGKVIVCCHSNYHVTLFEMSETPVPRDSALLRCMGVYSSDNIIVDTELSPYITGEFLMLDETGGLSLVKKNGEIISIPSHGHHFALCCYGSQPRSLLLATPTELFHLDIRDSISSSQPVPIFTGHNIACLSHDIDHPFRVLVATETSLFLLDIRQPSHHLLAVQHQLSHPPSSLSQLISCSGKTLVLLTSPKHCQSVVVCYNGRHSPPYFVLRPHSITTPSEQLAELKGVSFSSCLPLFEWRFSLPALGSTIISIDRANFAAILLTSLGDLFYHSWHYQTGRPSSLTASGYPLSPSLHLGYRLWLEEALRQQQEMVPYMDLPAAGTMNLDPLLQYLLTAPKLLCFNCYYVHTQHFPQLDIEQYLTSETSDNCCVSTSDQTRCRFCSIVLNRSLPSQPASKPPLTSDSGLESLREACSVREPQNELEFSLVRGWMMGGAELQRHLLEAADTPSTSKGEMDTGTQGQRRDSDKATATPNKATPTPSHSQSSAKKRRIGF